MKKIFLLMLLVMASYSCAPNFNFQNTFNPSPRVSYERKLRREFPALAEWRLAHDNALLSPRSIKLPHGGRGVFKTDEFPVYSYRFNLQAGEVLDAEVVRDSVGQNLFIDLY